MRLNKYIAHSGVCSRRKAADLVKSGQIKVNGETELKPYYLVREEDVVTYKGKALKPESEYVYYLLNKPRNVISTVSDPRGRKTVLDFIEDEKQHRIYPVGRLDRNTTGLLLLTNDGGLAKKITHPSFEVSKVYEVQLEREISEEDLRKLRTGFELEDGFIAADVVHRIDRGSQKEVWISINIHSGRNRIIRRMIKHLGYKILNLDRTFIAGLTKKGLKRGWYRSLSVEEVRRLKHFNKL